MKKNKGKKLGLTTWIFIALLAGAVTGIVLHYLIPSGYIKDTVVINGVFLCAWKWISPAYADAGRSLGVLLSNLWKCCYWRYTDTGKGRG